MRLQPLRLLQHLSQHQTRISARAVSHGHESNLHGLQGSMESMDLNSYTRSMGDNRIPVA